MLDKFFISSLASLIAYEAHPTLKAYLEKDDRSAKDLLPGRLATAVIAGAGTYAGLKAYNGVSEKVRNPFKDNGAESLAALKNPGMLINLVNTGLQAYSTIKVSDNSHKIVELTEVLSKWTAGQKVEAPRNTSVETELKT